MIVKILSSKGDSFHAVRYTTSKVQKGQGELLLMENFPKGFSKSSSAGKVRAYYKELGDRNARCKKKQFHMVLSSRYQSEKSSRCLEGARSVMQGLGYKDQPVIYVEHRDTENTHLHVVSVRVNVHTGKVISDFWDGIRAYKELSLFKNQDHTKKIKDLLSYKIQNLEHLKILLFRGGYKIFPCKKDEGIYKVFRGVVLHSFNPNDLGISKSPSKESATRVLSIAKKKAIEYSPLLFTVNSDRKEPVVREGVSRAFTKELQSELQSHLKRNLGIDIILERAGTNADRLLGGLVIDHDSKEVYPLDQVVGLQNQFNLTKEEISKREFLRLQNYEISSIAQRDLLLSALKNPSIKPFMVFNSKEKKRPETMDLIAQDALSSTEGCFIKGAKIVLDLEGSEFHFLHQRLHFLGELKSLIGNDRYQEFEKSPKAMQLRTLHESRKMLPVQQPKAQERTAYSPDVSNTESKRQHQLIKR
ncbi:relaxase/mobilization nuclease domain-containing protein [Planobacterium oryzisoli]|uniref:Relaxase/mobilization nuclease domain-containing protein n=1 Tax=Planobacterium oryzisoli TaxID=2771435 RepID=A0A930YV58_9FLAO|nr:relaxase/mobilization nuclease domain-containing protein [Planobacterium oryzisoli]MBF5026942.1 relaxase/mobilization nuclease domain-containing protein [Planobacterium oryzisoli]